MANYRGQTGALFLGGNVRTATGGSPLVKGAVASAGAVVTVDATAGAIGGVIIVGDQFVVAGDGVTRTVTGGPFYAVNSSATSNYIDSVGFTPAATAGMAANATMTFTNNSVAELRDWSMQVDLEQIDDTTKGDVFRTFRGGLVSWTGSARAYLDYDDTEQAALIDELATASPDGTLAGIQFQVDGGTNIFKAAYGAAELRNFTVLSPEGSSLVEVSFDFQGTGQLYWPTWL